MFTNEEFQRYLRQMILDGFHREGQIKLKQAKVLVIGAGGLGCSVLQYLTAAGIGHIGVVDFDTIEVSNLHRQVLYRQNDIGKMKAEVAAEILRQLNPFAEIKSYSEKLNENNAEQLINLYDVVVDGCDNFATRYLVNDTCVRLGKPLVYGSVLGYEGQIALFNVEDGGNLRDVFSEPPNPKDVPNCNDNGVLGTVPGLVGTFMAQLVIRHLLGDNQWRDKMIILNTLTFETTFLDYSCLSLSEK